MKTHVIRFDEHGKIAVDATGYVGKSCADTTAKLLAGLGADTTKDNKKREFNQRETTVTNVRG